MEELSLLKYYCENDDFEKVKEILKEKKNEILVNQLDQFGDSILHGAVSKGRIEIVEYLVKEMKCNVNIVNSMKSTPLHKAVTISEFKVQMDMVRFLMKNGADPLLKNGSGMIPEQITKHSKCKELLQGDANSSEYLTIDKAKFGRVIGKGGNNINDIKLQSSTTIDFPNPKSKDSRIKITGRKENIELAKSLILESIKERTETDDEQDFIDEAQKEIDENNSSNNNNNMNSVEQLNLTTIPKDKHGRIIGKGGEKIQYLNNEFNVKIKIPPSDSTDSTISILGSPDNINKVMKYINEKLLKDKPKDNNNGKKYNNNNNIRKDNNKKRSSNNNNNKPNTNAPATAITSTTTTTTVN